MNGEMDLDDWEFILAPRNHHQKHHHPHEYDHEFFDYRHDDDDDAAPTAAGTASSDTKVLVNMNYFICPSPSTSPPITTTVLSGGGGGAPPPNQLIPVVPTIQFLKEDDHEITDKVPPVEMGVVPAAAAIDEKIIKSPPYSEFLKADDGDGDRVSRHVLFKKIKKETEFVDTKLDLDSPKFSSSSSSTSPVSIPQQIQTDATVATAIVLCEEQQQDKERTAADVNDEIGWSGKQEESNKMWWWWRLGFTGVGALCSFGIAATTICVLIFSSSSHHTTTKLHYQYLSRLHQNRPHHHKRIKQVAAPRLNLNLNDDATISAARRGVPLTSAHISFGSGCYHDGL